MVTDDIFYSPEDNSSIFVSKLKPETIDILSQELNNDKRYSKRYTSGVKIRERFACKIICSDCNNNICNQGPMPLWHNMPLEIECAICGFVYHPKLSN